MAILLISLGLVGCNADGTIDPTLGGIIGFETESKRGNKGGQTYQVGTADLQTDVDVDTAYLKIKREFGFLTYEERLAKSPNLQRGWLEKDTSFKHTTIAGVSYQMKNRVPHAFGGEKRSHNFEANVEKDGEGSIVMMKFWIPSQDGLDVEAYSKSIEARARNALGV
ncbi:MAG: hypothetical protein AAGA21_19195 [Pseudomonadota bacterium]